LSDSVLLAEDNAADVLFFKRACQKVGWSPSLKVVANGHDALTVLSGGPASAGVALDRAILDIKLPLLSGLEILKWIRASERWAGLPVVVLTSSQQPEDIEAAFRLGCDAYLVKPVKFADLTRVAGALRAWSAGGAFQDLPERMRPPS